VAIAQVNKTTYASSSSLTTHTNTFGWTATKRNLLVACITSAATFNLTAGWTRVANPTDFAETDIWYKVADGTETALAVTCTGATTACLIGVTEWSGDTGLLWALDRSVSANNTATTAQPGTTAATRDADELAMYCFGNGGGGASAYTGTTTGGITTEYNGSDAGSTNHLLYASEILSAKGTVTATATSSASSHHSSVIATFRMMPPTLINVCGAECGLVSIGGTTAGVRHWSTVTGTPTVLTTHPFDSERCYRFNAAGSPVNLTHTFAAAIASPGTQVTRFKIYFNGSLPSNDCYFVTALGLSSFQYDAGTGKIGCGGTLGTLSLAGPTVAANTVYEVEYSITRDTAIGTRYKLTVNGTDYGEVDVAGVSAGGTTYVIGVITNTITADVYIDDIVVSSTIADYPIGPGIVAGLYPNGDGTHGATWASGAFGKGAGGATAAARTDTDIWQSLANPLSASVGTNFVASVTIVALTEFTEFTLEDLPAEAERVNGAMVVATCHSASTTSNRFYLGVRNIGGGAAEFSAVWNAVDFSETGLQTVCLMRNVDSINLDPWTVATINGNGFRFSSTDSTPDMYLDGAMMEVDYAVAAASGDATGDAGVVVATVTVLPAIFPDGTGNAGVVVATVTRGQPTGGAGGTTVAPVARAVTLGTATASAGGTTQTQPHAATLLAPTGGAGGTTVAPVARAATVLAPTGGVSTTTLTLPISAFMPVPTGGAGGTTITLPVNVTVPQPTGSSPDATGQAGVVVATATMLTATAGAGGTAGAVQPSVVSLAPTGSAGGTTQAPVARTVAFPVPTGGASGTTTTLPINVVVLTASAGGGASASAGVVVATVTPLTPTGGAQGTAQTQPHAATLLTPTGGAGGTTQTLPINVTVLQAAVAGDATGQAGVVAATASVLTPTGGAQGTTQAQPHAVTVLQPSMVADATGQAGVVVATATVRTPTAGAGGTTTALPVNVTVLGLPSAGGATAGVVAATATVLTPTGSASGTAGVVVAAVVTRTPTASAGGATTALQASVAVQSPTGGAGGTTQALARTVTVLLATAVGQSVGQAGVVVATVTVRAPTGGAGGTAQTVPVVVTVPQVFLFTGTFPGGVLVGVGSGGPGVVVGSVGGDGPGVTVETSRGGGVTVGSS